MLTGDKGDATKKEPSKAVAKTSYKSESVSGEMIRKTIKRKNMTPAARNEMDIERERTILKYRQMKELKQRPLANDY